MVVDPIVIGLDSSTTATKVLAVDRQGNIIAQASRPIALYQPGTHLYEQNAADWWNTACEALRDITRRIDPSRIKALAISNQRETFVPLDKDGMVLRPAIVWLDERCKDEVEPFAQSIGHERIQHITGKPVDYAPVVYRLAWMKKHETDLYNKISMICDVHTWLVWKLSGTFTTSWASADPLGAFDMAGKQWSGDILDALNLSAKQLPQLCSPGTVIAPVTPAAAQATGLDSTTWVVSGAGDGQAAGLGVNALDPQRAYLNLGTAVVTGIYHPQYLTDKAFRTLCACADSGYYYECSLRAGTFAIDWFVKNILAIDATRQPEIYAQLEKEAQECSAAADGLFFLPYINGVMNPYWDSHARGAFTGLSSAHKRGHMYRAILEGIALEQLLAILAVEKTAKIKVNELMTIGGGAGSQLWCTIMAAVTGKNIAVPKNKEASGLGAAICAAVATGWYTSFKEAAAAMTSIEKVIKPYEKLQNTYTGIFENYKNIYPTLKNL